MAESLIISAAFSVISSTLNSIATLVWNEIIFFRGVPEKVQLIKTKLRLIEGYLKDAEHKPQRSHFTESWLREIKRVAYRSQDVIEKINCLQPRRDWTGGCASAFSRYSNIRGYLKSLKEIGEEIDKINMFIPGIIDMANNLNVVNIGESSSMANQIDDHQDPRSAIHISDEDEVVGFDIEIRKIVNELLDPANKQLSVVSILGMGGIGKSTLARKVFNHSRVKTKFHINIWITISQRYDVLALQKEILKAINPNGNEDFEKFSIEELRENVLVYLKEKKIFDSDR